jgi:NAD(P)-dependent dehydrogenase (short-subunit alcohol dehydrogenase family)
VGVVGRDEKRLAKVGRAAAQQRVEVWKYMVQLDSMEELQWLAESVLRDFSGLHVLVHCAAELLTGPVDKVAPSDFERMWRVNVHAPYALTHWLLPALRKTRGDVVFMNSRAAWLHHPNLSHYCATKAALQALANSLREEAGGAGVRVLSVFPGRVATPMQARLMEAEGRSQELESLPRPQEVARLVVSALKMPDHAEVTDITLRPQPNPRARAVQDED